jgi:Putative lumazine-binding
VHGFAPEKSENSCRVVRDSQVACVLHLGLVDFAICVYQALESGAMKRLRWLCVLACVAAATPLFALTPAEQEVLVPVNALFDGMAKRDAAAIKQPTLPGGMMVLMRDGKATQMSFEAFAERVGKPSKVRIEERIHDPLIKIDGDLAMVWAPFEFLADGKVDHCGTDLFNLVRSEGKWVIAGVADTGHHDCAVQ